MIAGGLRDYPWEQCYATSDIREDGRPVDILQDFYIPALSRSTRYDRVAGYFTSTSLAAASQGFSRFVAQGGKARFVVGLQLEPQDAAAILQGDQLRASECLLAELEDAPHWPAQVQHGVELLAWMVARGVLEIRVGLRVHGKLGTPQPLDYAQDGYLHEKWAIFDDGRDALFISGSLNESRTALAVNAENITVQPSWIDWNRKLFKRKRASFEALWAGTHAYIRTLTLPEAVAARLIQMAEGAKPLREIDGTPMALETRHQARAVEDSKDQALTPSFGERLRFALIRLAPLLPGGERTAMETTPIEPWPHQRFVAQRLLETYPRNHLLCDEVGLGKTIEAGLTFRALWLSGRAKSIRVFAPASLTPQWLNEMAEKFLLPFVRRTNRSGDWARVDLRSGEVIQGSGSPFDAPLEEEGRQRAAIGFYLCFLRLRFASSFHALRCSLERRLIKIAQTLAHKAQQLGLDEDDPESLEELDEYELAGLVLKNRSESDLTWEQTTVEALLQTMQALPAVPRKTHQLLEHIEQRRRPGSDRVRQLVVFTRYADTLDALHTELCRRLPRCPIGTFSGAGGSLRRAGEHQPEGMDRTAIKQRFVAGHIDILLCTDAAAEGLNLQSADLLINFDLPWNPMMLEQRIGRIDRIGQHHQHIHVYNYLYQDSVEEVVYGRLVMRFREAISVAGELQFSLLPIQPEDFEDFAKSADELGHIDEEELIRRAQAHAKQISERQRLTEFPAQEQKAAYERLEEQARAQPLPASLESIWRVLSESAQPGGYLHRLGARIETFGQGEALVLEGVLGLATPVLLTTSRDLFEEGLGADDRRRLHFATYGDPIFEQLLAAVLKTDPDLFQQVQRCWEERQALASVALEGRRLTRVEDALAIGALAAQPVQLLPRATAEPARQSDQVGRLQRVLLETTAAHFAKVKLKEDPDTVKQQIAGFERFQDDVARRSPPAVYVTCEVPDRNAMLAVKESLLWPVANAAPGLGVDGDLLLLDAVRAVLLRQLGEMKKNQRTGPAVARTILDRVRSA
ncbi:MAG: hypothetical protein EOM91_17570 [Sphingobacteriia bacterium]|nr:hypothetical protein [Sphingobacteriia bacterium]NCC40802.1 hypothetical protein [Gammaproteobacteria bacterium]